MEDVKVKFPQKCHNPLFKKDQGLIQGCRVGEHVPSYDSVVPGEGTRGHYVSRYSKEEVFRPGMRQVDHLLYSEEQNNRGKKFVSAPKLVENVFDGKKHFYDEYNRVTKSSNMPCVEWTTKKHIEANKSKEYDMEGYMNRKQRVPDISAQRNHVGIPNPGDKPYKSPDRDVDFFVSGGLIPGSSISLRKSAKPTLRKKDEIPTGSIGDKQLRMTFSEKQKHFEHQAAIDEIRSLNVSLDD